MNQSDGGLVDAGTLVAHAAAVIDHQPHADGNVFTLEDGKLLFDSVFKDAKIFGFEAIGKTLTVVKNGRVQNDQVNVNLDAGTLLARVHVLPRRGWRRTRHRNLGEGC